MHHQSLADCRAKGGREKLKWKGRLMRKGSVVKREASPLKMNISLQMEKECEAEANTPLQNNHIVACAKSKINMEGIR